MTEADLKALWARWMHRRDLTEDMDTVYAMAQLRVQERMLLSVNIATVLAEAPRMLIHAGLAYLHELVRDAEGQGIEDQRFEEAVTDYSMRSSLAAHGVISPFTFDEDGYGT